MGGNSNCQHIKFEIVVRLKRKNVVRLVGQIDKRLQLHILCEDHELDRTHNLL